MFFPLLIFCGLSVSYADNEKVPKDPDALQPPAQSSGRSSENLPVINPEVSDIPPEPSVPSPAQESLTTPVPMETKPLPWAFGQSQGMVDANLYLESMVDRNQGISFVYGRGPITLLVFQCPSCPMCPTQFKKLKKIVDDKGKISALVVFFPKDLINIKINVMLNIIRDGAGPQWSARAFQELLENQSWKTLDSDQSLHQAMDVMLQACKDVGEGVFQDLSMRLKHVEQLYRDIKNIRQIEKDQSIQEAFNIYKAHRESFAINRGVPMFFLRTHTGFIPKGHAISKDLEMEMEKDQRSTRF